MGPETALFATGMKLGSCLLGLQAQSGEDLKGR